MSDLRGELERVTTTLTGGRDLEDALWRMFIGACALVIGGLVLALFLLLLIRFPVAVVGTVVGIVVILTLGGLATRGFWEVVVPMWQRLWGDG